MNRHEQAMQMEIAKLLRMVKAPPERWTAVQPQGRTKKMGAIMQGMGVNAGWPDLIFVLDDGKIAGIELKYGKGDLNAAQQKWAAMAMALPCVYAICRSVEDVFFRLRTWGFPGAERVTFTTTNAPIVHGNSKP